LSVFCAAARIRPIGTGEGGDDVLGNRRPARQEPRTTYLSELLGAGPMSAGGSLLGTRERRPAWLTWAFGLVAAAALVVGVLLVYDVLMPGVLSAMVFRDASTATRTGLSSCSVPAPATRAPATARC
jgi:hypothetical protein